MCAQSCVTMALGMLADRGARVYGSFTATYLAINLEKIIAQPDQASPTLDTKLPPLVSKRVRGLNPEEVERVIERSEARCHVIQASCFTLRESQRNVYAESMRLMISRIIESSVDTRHPVIFPVETNTYKWESYSKGQQEKIIEKYSTRWRYDPTVAHAVVIVGYRKTGNPPRSLSLVVHDPSSRPYRSIAWEDLRKANSVYAAFRWVLMDKPILPNPKRTKPSPAKWKKMGPEQQHQWLITNYRSDLNAVPDDYPLFTPDDVQPENFAQILMITTDRWIKCNPWRCFDDIARRPDGKMFSSLGGFSAGDYRVRLIQPNQIAELIEDGYHNKEASIQLRGIEVDVRTQELRARIDNISKVAKSLPERDYWCFAGYFKNLLIEVWVFDATDTRGHKSGGRIYQSSSHFRVQDAEACVDGIATQEDLGKFESFEQQPLDLSPVDGQRKEMEISRRMLHPSVITSSSGRHHLSELIDDLAAISDVGVFDLMVLREEDIDEIIDSNPELQRQFPERYSSERPSQMTTSYFLKEYRQYVHSWFEKEFSSARTTMEQLCNSTRKQPIELGISGFATYFPDITASLPEDRVAEVECIVDTVCFASELADKGYVRTGIEQDQKHLFIEIVCGSIVDRSSDHDYTTESRVDFVNVYQAKYKMALLEQSLRELVNELDSKPTCVGRYTLCLELEPGPLYLFNGVSPGRSIPDMIAMLERNAKLFSGKIALNLDIAHMRIASIPPEIIQQHAHWFAHAHISDHPGLHTRDQTLGKWTVGDAVAHEGYLPYLKAFAASAAASEREGAYRVPYSGHVAVELEGCNRIQWVRDSLSALKFLTHKASS